MPYRLTIEDDAKQDLRLLFAGSEQDRSDAGKVVAFLHELANNQQWLAELLSRHFTTDEFNVDKFVSLWNEGYDIWRLKIAEITHTRNRRASLPLRVIYCHDRQTYRVLAICKRDFNYDPNHEQTKRLRRLYSDLGLPQYSVRGRR
jgi:hypothetical protein